MQFLDWRDEHTFEGKFWLPSVPENRVAGRVLIKGGSFPILSTLSPLLPDGHERPEYLLGSIRSGDVSLLGCALMVRDAPWSKSEFSSQKIGFDGILLGRHAAPQNFARRLRLRFTNVRRLAAGEVWTFAEPGSPSSKPDHVTVHVRTDEHVLAVEHEGVRIEVRVSAPVNASHASRGDELKVKPEVDVYVEFPELISVSEARQLWDDLELFWSVMTGTHSDLIAAFVSDESATDGESHDDITTPYIGVVHSDAADAEAFGDFLYDLTRGPHPGKLADVLRTWLERRGVLRLGARLLVDTWNKNVSWESKLGIIAQALEAFHRASPHRQTFVDRNDYEPIQQELETRISELTPNDDLRTSLRKRVEFGNQLSLRRRTKDLMRVMPPELRDAFGKWQPLADEMVQARNATIHRDPSSPPASFRETVRIAGHFGLTVHVALAQAIGVPDDVIANRLQMQPPYQDWLSYRRR